MEEMERYKNKKELAIVKGPSNDDQLCHVESLVSKSPIFDFWAFLKSGGLLKQQRPISSTHLERNIFPGDQKRIFFNAMLHEGDHGDSKAAWSIWKTSNLLVPFEAFVRWCSPTSNVCDLYDTNHDRDKDQPSLQKSIARNLLLNKYRDKRASQKVDTALIQARLFKTGVVKSNNDFEFVQDKVSKEVLALQPTHNESQKQGQTDDNKDLYESHVKTGVWEVLTFAKDKDGTPNEPFYVVTGVSEDDRVDTKKLRKAIFAGQTYTRRPKISLATKDVAEHLTGYKSGTMAPILHTVDSKLFLEESIFNTLQQEQRRNHKIIVGSGMFGKCLSLDADKFLQVAKMNPKGFEVCSLISKKKDKDKQHQ